jgi:hypothetical protein
LHSCAIATGRSDADATELAGLCRGHSLRAGYWTASAMASIPEWKARRSGRHHFAERFAGYVRPTTGRIAASRGSGSEPQRCYFLLLKQSPRLTDPEFGAIPSEGPRACPRIARKIEPTGRPSGQRYGLMIENIKDSRKRPHHWKRINAIVEPTWHDNENWPDRDQSERGPDDLANQTTIRC